MRDKLLSQRISAIKESATLALNAKVKALAASGVTVYNLTAGEPDDQTPQYIINKVSDHLHENKYTPISGMPVLKDAIVQHARSFYDANWMDSSMVVVTAGAKPALSAIMQSLLNPGDEVIVPTPAWVSYTYMVQLADGVIKPVPLQSDFDLDVDALQAAITDKTKAIIINSPNNPTGKMYSSSALKKLAKALENTDVFIIADDLYTKLVFEPFTPITSCGFTPDKLIIVNGFSKSQALTGWRIGYVIAPTDIAQSLNRTLSHTSGNASVPSQYAAIGALEVDDTPPMLENLRTRRDIVARALSSTNGISFTLPDGAFYFFIDIHQQADDAADWCADLLEQTGVALVPGNDFYAPGFVRLSYAVDEETLTAALQKISQFIQSYSQRQRSKS